MFNEMNMLVPKDFGGNLSHIELSENSFVPSKWKEARVDGIKTVKGAKSPSFNASIFDFIIFWLVWGIWIVLDIPAGPVGFSQEDSGDLQYIVDILQWISLCPHFESVAVISFSEDI